MRKIHTQNTLLFARLLHKMPNASYKSSSTPGRSSFMVRAFVSVTVLSLGPRSVDIFDAYRRGARRRLQIEQNRLSFRVFQLRGSFHFHCASQTKFPKLFPARVLEGSLRTNKRKTLLGPSAGIEPESNKKSGVSLPGIIQGAIYFFRKTSYRTRVCSR